MRLVLGTYSTNSDFNGGCDFALIDLTPDYARQILSRMQAVKKLSQSDSSLHEAYFWDFHAQYFETPLDEDFDAKLDGAFDRHVELDAQTMLPEELFKCVEYTHLIISVMGDEAEASWRASPKNAPEYVETNSIPQSLVAEVAGEGGLAPCP